MKKMFVVISTYLKSLEEINEKRGDHLAFINNYVLAGKFIMLGRKNPVDGAVIIAHNVTREELEDIFKNDPYFVKSLNFHLPHTQLESKKQSKNYNYKSKKIAPAIYFNRRCNFY